MSEKRSRDCYRVSRRNSNSNPAFILAIGDWERRRSEKWQITERKGAACDIHLNWIPGAQHHSANNVEVIASQIFGT
jgi:hypothetical protein